MGCRGGGRPHEWEPVPRDSRLRLRPRSGQAPERLTPTLFEASSLHASALGAAILPPSLPRPSSGVNSNFQHKTNMAAAAVEASGECPDGNGSHDFGPAPGLEREARAGEGRHLAWILTDRGGYELGLAFHLGPAPRARATRLADEGRQRAAGGGLKAGGDARRRGARRRGRSQQAPRLVAPPRQLRANRA